MKKRIFALLLAAMLPLGAANFLSVADKHCPDGDFAVHRGFSGFLERKAHPNFVVLHNSSFILFPDENAPRCAANFSLWLTRMKRSVAALR